MKWIDIFIPTFFNKLLKVTILAEFIWKLVDIFHDFIKIKSWEEFLSTSLSSGDHLIRIYFLFVRNVSDQFWNDILLWFTYKSIRSISWKAILNIWILILLIWELLMNFMPINFSFLMFSLILFLFLHFDHSFIEGLDFLLVNFYFRVKYLSWFDAIFISTINSYCISIVIKVYFWWG